MWEILRGLAEYVSICYTWSYCEVLLTNSDESAISGEALTELSISSTNELDGDTITTLGGKQSARSRDLGLRRANINLNSTVHSGVASIDTREVTLDATSASDMGNAQRVGWVC